MKYLDRVLDSLLKQTIKIQNLIVIYDGSDSEFIQVRNKIVQLKLDNVICVPSTNLAPAQTIPDRRRHITNIHNQMKELIGATDWVFSVEDDGILPPDALERLIEVIENEPSVGMVTGVELGRWGVPYVGAWEVDNVFEPHSISSMPSRTTNNEIQQIDACGLYCALIRADKYKEHRFFASNGLGPDVNLGLFLRQQGFRNYIHWAVHVTHLTLYNNEEIEIKATDQTKEVTLTFVSGSTWQH